MKLYLFLFIILTNLNAWAIPHSYTELVDYLQPAPDQGETNTCLFMSTTGAVELLLNKKYGIKNPKKGGPFDISERFTISYPTPRAASWYEAPTYKFNNGWAIHENTLPYDAYLDDGTVNNEMWYWPTDFYNLPRMEIKDRFETERIFIRGGKYATYVLKDADLTLIKEVLVKYESPILINYNDEGWWHMILIVGYDDNAVGECYYTPSEECRGKGAFIVRDSNGLDYEYRDYDWFRVNGSAAFVVKFEE